MNNLEKLTNRIYREYRRGNQKRTIQRNCQIEYTRRFLMTDQATCEIDTIKTDLVFIGYRLFLNYHHTVNGTAKIM